MRILIVVLLGIFIFLQYNIWFSKNGLIRTRTLRKEVASKEAANAKLHQRNQKLITQVQDLKHSKKAIETLAREQVGMVKQGEKYYQIVD